MTQSPRKQRLRIRLNRSFKTFTKKDRAEFIDDVASAAGVLPSSIAKVSFKRGCVYFECEIDPEAARRLQELFESVEELRTKPEYAELVAFIEKWNVADVTATIHITVVSKSTPKSEIVLIHGWTGSKESFGDLPQFLAKATDVPVYVYDYPTSLWQASRSPSTVFIAANLDNWTRNNTTAENLGFVAHSMGGLILRRLVVEQSLRREKLTPRLRQLTFVASPTNGAALAKLAKVVLPSVQLDELSPNSPLLLSLNSHWDAWVRDKSETCSIRSIYSPDDGIVSVNNARGNDPDAVPILNATHSEIVRPTSQTAEVVVTLARFMKEAGVSSGRARREKGPR